MLGTKISRSVAVISVRPRMTVGTVMDSHGGNAPGFHNLRIMLALLIMLYHSYVVANGSDADMDQLILRPITFCFLPMFFSLSGFLVMGSALRTKSLPIFLSFRILKSFRRCSWKSVSRL